jgi:hypothetical protein
MGRIQKCDWTCLHAAHTLQCIETKVPSLQAIAKDPIMQHGLFDDSDVTALARALIPWTAAVIVPTEAQARASLVRRTMRGQALPEWRDRDDAAVVQVARAARAVYIAKALDTFASLIANALRRAFSGAAQRPRLAGARR